MLTNLRKIQLVFKLSYLFICINGYLAFSQTCDTNLPFTFQPSANGVNWKQFPTFSLPFQIIYAGNTQIANAGDLLERGFTHIANPNGNSFLPSSNRAFIYYGVANANQPWDLYKSPYGNDLNVYHKKWDDELAHYQNINGGTLDFDIFCLDIEMQHKSRDSILAIQKMDFVPSELKSLNNDAFVIQYQKDMQALYSYAAAYIKNKVNARIFTSYGDVPVFNTFTNIQGPTWDRWKTDPSLLYYITYDFNKKQPGGEYYNLMDYLSPNAYYYYDYPHIFAPEYLSYLLFQIEVNSEWSSKNQLVFLWNRYSYTPQYVGKDIKPWMAEAMAIFPFFSGAKGLWLWDDPINVPSQFSNYEYFMKGLYRLSQFKNFFEGDYQLIRNITARDYNENQMPIWRGVLKNNKLLVVAQNPWAKAEDETRKIQIQYGNLNEEIVLKGYEIFMCEFNVDMVTGIEKNDIKLNVFPNPTKEFIQYSTSLNTPYKIQLLDISGRVFYQKENISDSEGIIPLPINLKNAAILSIEFDSKKISKRIIIHE